MLHNIYFTDTELDAQVKTIVDFLSTVHPELCDNSTQNTCVELRPINRSGEFNISLNRSLNLWRLDKKSIDFLRVFLHKHNGQPYCLYYSVFAFDYTKESYTKAGKKAIKGKITSDAALFANEIVLDFDGIDYLGFEKLCVDLEAAGIEGLWVFTGHGYQLHLLLKDKMSTEHELFNLVYLFRSKGFLCDTSCVDSARLMRLPFTYNCKCFSSEEFDDEYNNPPLCKIVKETSKRFSLEDIVAKLSVLETINEIDEKVYLDSVEKKSVKKNSGENSSDGASGEVVFGKVEYPDYFPYDDLPKPIANMLHNTPLGYRNSTLGLLIKYCKQYLLLGKQQILEVLNIWANYACEPAYNQLDFIKDFERLYQSGGLNYSSELAKYFGYIDFDNLVQIHRDNKILISNIIFQNLHAIDGSVLRAYLAVRILEHGNEVGSDDEIKITINEIADLTSMSIPTLKRVLPVARKLNLLYMIPGAKRKGEASSYHSNQINHSDAGFKALSVNDLEVYLSSSKRLKINDSELKLYLFMLYKFYTNDRAMSLKKIGKFIGLQESAVSKLVSSLKKKRYISVERVYKDDVVFFNKYTLLK